jgi:hypothetical protein
MGKGREGGGGSSSAWCAPRPALCARSRAPPPARPARRFCKAWSLAPQVFKILLVGQVACAPPRAPRPAPRAPNRRGPPLRARRWCSAPRTSRRFRPRALSTSAPAPSSLPSARAALRPPPTRCAFPLPPTRAGHESILTAGRGGAGRSVQHGPPAGKSSASSTQAPPPASGREARLLPCPACTQPPLAQ